MPTRKGKARTVAPADQKAEPDNQPQQIKNLGKLVFGEFHPERVVRPETPEEISDGPSKKTKKKYPGVLERLGPNALDFTRDSPPKLAAARIRLSDMIQKCADDPSHLPLWYAEKMDRWMGAALWERVRGQDVKNRTLTDSQIETLQADMLSGAWQHNRETIKITPNGQVIDGQGRLSAFLLSTRMRPDLVIVIDIAFNVPKETFKTLDTGKKRTSANALEECNISDPYTIGAMVRLWHAYHNGTMRSMPKVSNSQIVNIATSDEYKALFSKAARVAGTLKKDVKIPGAILGFVCALGMRADEDKTLAFFRQLGSGLDMSKGDPAWVLSRAMKNKPVARNRAGRVEVAALTIKALNAHFLGQSVEILRFVPKTEAFPRFVGDKKSLPLANRKTESAEEDDFQDSDVLIEVI